MVIIGVDAHKRMHAAVAVDASGTILSEWKGPNTATGWNELCTWGTAFPTSRQWGIEGVWNYGRGLAQYLVARGEQAFEVNPRWTAQ